MDCGGDDVALGDPRWMDCVVEGLAAGVRFLFGWHERIGGVGVPGEVDPAFGWIDRAVSAARFDRRRDSKACDGVTDHLALAAAEAADGIAHEQNLWKVFAAQG